MNKSVEKNYFYNLIYQIVAIIIPIVTTPYISRVLGAENIGIYGYTLSISAYFILFGSLGVALYGKREIAYVQGNKENYTKIFWEVFLLRTITMIISLLLFYIILIRNNNAYTLYFKILTLELIGEAIDISWFFQGLEDFKRTVIRNLLVKLISLVCIFIFVKKPNDLVIYFLIYVLSILIGNLSLWLYLPKYLVKINVKSFNVFKHLKHTLVLFIPQIAVQIYTVLDRTMIGYFITNKSEVGFYTQSEKIVKLLLTIITAMGTVMLPRIANEFSKGNMKSIKNHISKSMNLVYFLSFPLIFGLISVNDAFVPVFFGKGYEPVIFIMNVISPIILLIGMSNVIGVQFLLPTKHQKEYTYSVVFGAIVNFIMDYILIRRLGAVGAAIGTVVAETVVTVSQLLFVRKQLDIKQILFSTWQYFLSAIIMFSGLLFIREYIDNNIISIAIQVIVGIIIYFACLLLLKNTFITEYIYLFKKKIHKL